MIAKEQFLAGVEFRVKGENTSFMYRNNTIARNTLQGYVYYATTIGISDIGFDCFTFLFSKEVSTSISFSDCTAIVNEPKEEAV